MNERLEPHLSELRRQAESLEGSDREAALTQVALLEEHASSPSGDADSMRGWLARLSAYGPLVPYVEAVLETMSNIGM